MADACNTRECLRRNLEDAGFDGETAERCMRIFEEGDTARFAALLKEKRKSLLDDIHAGQKNLDSLDYLIFQTAQNDKGEYKL